MTPPARLAMMLRDLEIIIELFEAGRWECVDVQCGETRLFLSSRPEDRRSWPQASPPPARGERGRADASPTAPVQAGIARQPAPTSYDPSPDEVVVTAPSPGTFYRAPKPAAPPYVESGQRVTPHSELCLIEIMKLFTTLRAGVNGVVRKILVADGDMIEVGQPLFVIVIEKA